MIFAIFRHFMHFLLLIIFFVDVFLVLDWLLICRMLDLLSSILSCGLNISAILSVC